MGWADVFVKKAEGCRAAAGTLESPASPWAGSAIPEDKARTVFLLWLGQASP